MLPRPLLVLAARLATAMPCWPAAEWTSTSASTLPSVRPRPTGCCFTVPDPPAARTLASPAVSFLSSRSAAIRNQGDLLAALFFFSPTLGRLIGWSLRFLKSNRDASVPRVALGHRQRRRFRPAPSDR